MILKFFKINNEKEKIINIRDNTLRMMKNKN